MDKKNEHFLEKWKSKELEENHEAVAELVFNPKDSMRAC